VVVRARAAQALGELMKHQPRVDPVVTELITGAKSNDEAVAGSLILTLSYVIKNAGENVGEKAREASLEVVSDAFKEPHDGHFRFHAARISPTDSRTIEYYLQSTAALLVALSTYENLVDSIVRHVSVPYIKHRIPS
jgi:hypothetical protein